MNRRKLIRIGTLGSISCATGINLYNPQSVQAFGPLFSLFLRVGLSYAIENATHLGLQGMLGIYYKEMRRRVQEWYDRRLDAQLAQRALIEQDFTDIRAVGIPNTSYKHILIGTKQEASGYYSPAIVLPRLTGQGNDLVAFSGPAAIGISYAANYLSKTTHMSLKQIQSALLPTRRHLDEWHSWEQDFAPISYETATSSNGVTIQYRRSGKHLNGSAEILVGIDVGHRLSFSVEVQFG